MGAGRPLPDMAFSKGLYLGDSDFTRRGAKFMSDENYARVESLRETWDPDALFVGYHAAPHVLLNENAVGAN